MEAIVRSLRIAESSQRSEPIESIVGHQFRDAHFETDLTSCIVLKTLEIAGELIAHI